MLPMYYPAASTRQELEGAFEPLRDLLQRQSAHSGCGQLYGKRYSLQLAAYLRHRLRAARREGEGGVAVAGSCQEQTSGLRSLQLFDRGRTLRVGRVERGHRPNYLSLYPQRFTARCHYAHVRARVEKRVRKAGCSLQEMLAVVHNQEQLFVLQDLL